MNQNILIPFRAEYPFKGNIIFGIKKFGMSHIMKGNKNINNYNYLK